MISDVPVGVFLSGGVDSSIVTYEMSRLKEQIDSFTIGFKLASNNGDVISSRIVSEQLGTNHRETILDPSVLSELEPVFSKMDEPFAITSMLPVYLNSKVTSKEIKVVLSGDGADELFGGYSRHRFFKYLLHLRKARVLPVSTILKIADSFLNRFNSEQIRKGNYYILKPILTSLETPQLAGKYLSFLECIDHDEKQKLMDPAIAEQFDELIYVKDFNDLIRNYGEQIDLNIILDFDMKTTLAGEMLSKVDKASMLSSLEVRVPFLDHHLVEFISSLPFDFKVGRKGKHILKECYKGLISGDILYARKRGFNLPLDNWIRSSWKHEFYKTFLSSQTEEIGFNKGYLINQFKEFCENKNIIGGKKFFFAYSLIRWYGNFMAGINDKN
jgi:asparagine synthase (glutamine-hydrolysing)